MKKTIAFVLAMLMVLSVVPFAFAENETNQTADDVVDEPDADDNETDADGNETEEEEVDEGTNETVIDEPDVDDNETDADDNETEEEEVDEGTNETVIDETEEDVVEIPDNVTQEAGITPDSPLWGLERAMERISLALTLGKSAKAKKGLAHARERLMEVQAMIAQKKLAKAARAQSAHDDIMGDVEGNVAELGDGDAVEELEDEVELEQALNQHRTLVQNTANLKLKVKGLTSEQRTQLNAMIAGLENSTSKVEVEVKAKKEKTKIKLKAKEGYTDEEIAQIAAQIEEAVASGKKTKLVLPGRGKDKDLDDDEDDGELEADDDVNATVRGKVKPEKDNKGKVKDEGEDDE